MIHLYCGDGKGKTTAAAGLALRAAGNGMHVLFVQFLKGRESGERKMLEKIPEVTVMGGNLGEKFTFQMTREEREQASYRNVLLLDSAFRRAGEEKAELLILDEAVTAVERDIIPSGMLRDGIERYRHAFEIVLTGSVPEEWMVEAADYVTDMEKIRHPYDRGIAARKGIEY